MNEKRVRAGRFTVFFLGLAVAMGTATAASAVADIPGIQGPSFQLSTGPTYIDTPDGDTLLIWAYADSGSPIQYPGPTLIVNEGDVVSVELTNGLSVPTSIVFPGQGEVTASGGSPGLLASEAAPLGGTVTYSFTATHAGTYLYHSGTQPDLQVEMGLLGALIVRPTGYDADTNRIAYGHADTRYDHEYLLLLSEMDPVVHDLVDFGFPELIDNTAAFPVLWFINGRNAVDTLADPGVPWQPHQPYNALIRTRPGEKVLLRFIGGGRDPHPFHPHGNHSVMIARDGRLLESTPGAGPDLGTPDFTHNILPGATYDTLFDWTGERLGWDIYGDPSDPDFAHDCDDPSGDGFDDDTDGAGPDIATHEWCEDHGKPIPVTLPGLQDVTFGGFYSGNAFLGSFGNLPPGEGGLNLNGGLVFPAHSHNEKELTNNDIFLGGMFTFVVIEPPWVEIP